MAMNIEQIVVGNIVVGDIVADKAGMLGPCGLAMSDTYDNQPLGLAVNINWLFNRTNQAPPNGAPPNGFDSAWRMARRAIRLHCPADKLL